MPKTHSDFSGARILLVDDSPMNILMGKTILEKWNCKIFIASDGKKAIQKIKDLEFDSVLIDLNMLEISGLDTTIFIRQNLNEELPIIGYATELGEINKDKFINAGINDFIYLPFKHKELSETLRKHLKLPEEKNRKLVDLGKLETMGDHFFLKKMVEIFLTETAKEIDSMKNALTNKNYHQVVSIAHKIKPSINYICIGELYEEVKAINVWEKEDEAMEEQTHQFLQKMERVFEQLKS